MEKEKMKYFLVSSLNDVSNQKENLFVRVNEICCIESDGTTLAITLSNGKKIGSNASYGVKASNGSWTVKKITLDRLLNALPNNFIRASKNAIVNIDLVDNVHNYFSSSIIFYYGDKEVAFSRRCSVEFRDKMRLRNQVNEHNDGIQG